MSGQILSQVQGKQGPYDFILRGLIEQIAGSRHKRISITEQTWKRVVYDSDIAGFAAMGAGQASNSLCLLGGADKRKTNSPHRRNLHAMDSGSFETLSTELLMIWLLWVHKVRALVRSG